MRFYRLTMAVLWSWALGVGLVLVLAPGVRPAQVGLARPHGPHATVALWFSAYLVLVLLLAGVVQRRLVRSGKRIPGQAQIGALLAGLYLSTGSLLLPMIVHAVIDIRGLLLVPAPTPGSPTYEPAKSS